MTEYIKECFFENYECSNQIASFTDNIQSWILEDLNKYEKLLGRKLYISSCIENANGINVTYAFGNKYIK